MRSNRYFLASVALALAMSAHALTPNEMTEAERRALPRWCEFTQSFDRSPRNPGHYHDHVARYGVGWTHVHHYCWALASLIRYYNFETSAQMKRTLANSALQDIDYVLRNAPEDFILRFEIFVRKARVLMALGALSEAHALSERIQTEWPDRSDSHGLVAEVLLQMNQRQNAKNLLIAAEPLVKDRERLSQIRSALNLDASVQ